MALRRVFVDRIDGSEATVTGRSAHHLSKVARLRPGEHVEVSDQQTAFRAVTIASSAAEVRFRVLEPLPSPRSARLDVSLAIIKFSRFDWAVEKLSEIGVRSVTPLEADRCDRRLVTAASGRVQRWARIAVQAAQQSRQLAAPAVNPPSAFEAVIRSSAMPGRILAEPGGEAVARACGRGRTSLLVGPEGGWTASEVDLATKHGFRPARIGTSILRSETAAVSMAAVITSQHDLRSAQ